MVRIGMRGRWLGVIVLLALWLDVVSGGDGPMAPPIRSGAARMLTRAGTGKRPPAWREIGSR